MSTTLENIKVRFIQYCLLSEVREVLSPDCLEQPWKISIVWRWYTRLEHDPERCGAPTIQESDLQAVDAINLTISDRGRIIITLQKNVEAFIRQEEETSLEGIDAKLKELQKELLTQVNSEKDYNSIAV